MRRFIFGSLVLAVLAFSAAPAQAALIRLTPQGLSPSEYEAAGFPTDPAIIPPDGFRLTYHGGGAETLVNPILLILGIPTGLLPGPLSIDGSSGVGTASVDPGGSGGLYGGNWDSSSGFDGTFTSSGKKVYDFLGLPNGSDSQNYANWSGATGLTSWNLFVYVVSFTGTMNHGDYVEFASSLPAGAYVIGYGCEATNGGGLCAGSGNTENTPFTFAGLVKVPEPGTLALMFMSGAFLTGMRRRRIA